jgi:hypothetical protein
MQPLHVHRPRRSPFARYPKNGWSHEKPVRYHSHARYMLFYLALLLAEIALLGSLLWLHDTGTWPVWKVGSIILANMLFALIVGNHHISRTSPHLAASVVLAGISMLILVVLSTLLTPDANGLQVLAYAWICALLVNVLRYYPGRRIRARRRF